MATITPGVVLPVSGNFVTTPSYSGTFIPSIWSGKLNAKFYTASVIADITNTNWQGDISAMGDKVIINNIPDVSIANYQPGVTLSYQVPSPNTLELQINSAKYFSFQINDVLDLQSKPKLMDMFAQDAAQRIKIAVDSDVLFNVYNQYFNGTTVNGGATAGRGGYNLGTDTTPVALSPTGTGTANPVNLITALAAVLDEQNIPENDRFLIIDPTTRYQLLNSNLQQAYLTGDATSPVRNGKIGMIDRFAVYVSNNLPYGLAGFSTVDGFGAVTQTTSAGTAKRRYIIAGQKSAITFASQMVKTETVRNPTDFGDYVRGLQIYGYKVIKPQAMVTAVVA